MRPVRHLLPLLALPLLSACASSSAPVQYYTLAPVSQGQSSISAPYRLAIASVGVPAQLDQPQLVIHSSNSQLQILDNKRWLSPLPEELQNSVALLLEDRLHASRSDGFQTSNLPKLRVKVQVRRFESWPGKRFTFSADWQLGFKGKTLLCHSQLQHPVPPGIDALVNAQQQTLAAFADSLASTAKGLVAGKGVCP
ncbi:PqiC family protein [Gallaecimonas mangrovi]|uniref:PqiC family protein n=1 Tax=Gallaecimonas mangrovi TaxID=2291597 RepID=UPI000E2073D5|nr:PqiC family protein [Gallaecimonas mangrovi]